MEGLGVIRELALTAEYLTAAGWATFNVAARHMKLTLDDGTIVTRPPIGAPIFFLRAIPNARHFYAVGIASFDVLGILDLLGPAFDD